MRIVLLVCAMAVAAAAQTPTVTNARLETKAVNGNALEFLHKTVASENGPMWFGYAVESDGPPSDSCETRLEDGRGEVAQKRAVHLEGSRELLVLYRTQNHEIQKIRPVSGECPLDAGGLRFVWITGVDAASSLALLSEQVSQREKEVALLTIGMHAKGGTEALIRFAKQDPSSHVRGQALFWLAQKAGQKSVRAIQDALENDPDTEVKTKAVFALQQLPKGEGVPLLIQVAKTNRNAEVRKQAMFWLGQSGDPRALAFFEEILAR